MCFPAAVSDARSASGCRCQDWDRTNCRRRRDSSGGRQQELDWTRASWELGDDVVPLLRHEGSTKDAGVAIEPCCGNGDERGDEIVVVGVVDARWTLASVRVMTGAVTSLSMVLYFEEVLSWEPRHLGGSNAGQSRRQTACRHSTRNSADGVRRFGVPRRWLDAHREHHRLIGQP